jgi:hypothetical protein
MDGQNFQKFPGPSVKKAYRASITGHGADPPSLSISKARTKN